MVESSLTAVLQRKYLANCRNVHGDDANWWHRPDLQRKSAIPHMGKHVVKILAAEVISPLLAVVGAVETLFHLVMAGGAVLFKKDPSFWGDRLTSSLHATGKAVGDTFYCNFARVNLITREACVRLMLNKMRDCDREELERDGIIRQPPPPPSPPHSPEPAQPVVPDSVAQEQRRSNFWNRPAPRGLSGLFGQDRIEYLLQRLGLEPMSRLRPISPIRHVWQPAPQPYVPQQQDVPMPDLYDPMPDAAPQPVQEAPRPQAARDEAPQQEGEEARTIREGVKFLRKRIFPTISKETREAIEEEDPDVYAFILAKVAYLFLADEELAREALPRFFSETVKKNMEKVDDEFDEQGTAKFPSELFYYFDHFEKVEEYEEWSSAIPEYRQVVEAVNVLKSATADDLQGGVFLLKCIPQALKEERESARE